MRAIIVNTRGNQRENCDKTIENAKERVYLYVFVNWKIEQLFLLLISNRNQND